MYILCGYCAIFHLKDIPFNLKYIYRRLLDKQERVDAIIASIDQAGGDDTQKDEIEQTITPTERDQIDTVKRTVQM